MINKKILSIIIFIYSMYITNVSAFIFETKNIRITKENNLIYAYEGKAFTVDRDVEIYANEFRYNKNLEQLDAVGNGVAKFKSKSLEIKFEESFFNKKKSTIIAKGNVIINQSSSLIEIKSSDILYDIQKEIISSNSTTFLYDDNKNQYVVDSFVYELKNDLLKLKNLRFSDIDNNKINTKLAYVNTKTGKIFGKDLVFNMNKNGFNENNEPRIKANSIIIEDKLKTINKGIFTTCKKRDGCPPWKITSEKVYHDKKRKMMNYENALVHVYDIPVFYFPKFFHPDPTVKRQSGFLVPKLNSSSSDDFLNTPYFFAISDNKDATFSPRFYLNEKFLLQTEYRELNLNSRHDLDFSFLTEKTKHQKNHLFYKYEKDLNLENFNLSNIELNLQKTSNDTYIKKDKLESPLISDNNILQNSIKFGLNNYSSSLNANVYIFEDLTKDNNDRYEYVAPEVYITKNIENKTKLNGEFFLNSNAIIRSYDTNITEKLNINDLTFNSYPKITSKGFYNNYEFLIRNSNTDNQNSQNYKKNENYYLSSILQINSSLPMIKESKLHKKILKPKISLRMSPDFTKNESSTEYIVDNSNIYSLSRTTSAEVVEGGTSLVVGGDYNIFNNDDSRQILGLKIANNIRFKENNDLSKNNQLNEKTSNFFNQIEYSPVSAIKMNYKSSVKNDLSTINYETLLAELSFNKLVTKFDYLNENNTNEKNSYLGNKTEFFFDETNSISFSTRKNKRENLTEYYNWAYQYKNDCLVASVEYNKDFYSDRDLKPSENIFFKLTLIPFGQVNSPSLID